MAVFFMDKVITALIKQKKDPNRINVFLDGSFAFGLDRFVGAWLKVGQTLSEQRIEQLLHQNIHENVRQKVFHYMSFRNRSEFEIRNNLIKKGFDPDVINDVIEEMKEKKLIGDDQFAKEWVDERIALKPRGKRLLAFELRQKKVDQAIIDQVLLKFPDEASLSIKAGHKVADRYAHLEYKVFRKKMFDYLARRGFNFDVIQKAVTFLWEEQLKGKLN
jgi:regulatory protein